MKKNKILFINSSIATLTPIATVVACSASTFNPSEEQITQREIFQKAFNTVETHWFVKVINQLYKDQGTTLDVANITNALANADFKSKFEYFLMAKGQENKTFLSDYAKELTKYKDDIINKTNKPFTLNDLSTWNFFQILDENGTTTKKLTIEGMRALLEKNIKNIKHDFFKFLISEKYLEIGLTKENWKKVFLDNTSNDYINLNEIEEQADGATTDFLLLRWALDKKPFLKWNITLDETKSKQFIGKADLNTFGDADIALKSGGEIFKLAKYSQQNSKLINATFETNDATIKILLDNKLTGFQRIKFQNSISGNERGILSFTKSEMEKATSFDKWSGYQHEEKLLNGTDKIPYFTKEGNVTVELNRLIGLMPIYKDDKYTFTNSIIAGSHEKTLLAEAFAIKDLNTIYSEALTWYTKKNHPILIEINPKLKYLKEQLIDKGAKFIQDDTKK